MTSSRQTSRVAPGWWDYTTLDGGILADSAGLSVSDLEQLSRPGFTVRFYDTLEEFYCAEALEYVYAFSASSPDRPAGICGPIGPTEQLPLVARMINELRIDVREGHFWAMDEWFLKGKEAPPDHPLSFARADLDLCFNRIDPALRMPDNHLHFLTARNIDEYSKSYDHIRCKVMQGGQGDVKHWAFNDPPKREGRWAESPPSPDEYRALGTRIVDLHPMTIMQNARTSGGGQVSSVPEQAISVGPVETWKSDRVSIWHAGTHDNAFGMRLTAFMISKGIADSSVPMSLLAGHPNVVFSYFRPGIGSCDVEMH